MSYIMRRERVFEEPNLSEVPPRNEGKLKAYNSCTDTRAWSHHRANQSEHLFELIRRNTGKCTKFIPLDVIVDMLTGAKNAEIDRLKKLVEELQKLLADRNQMRTGVPTAAQGGEKVEISEPLGVNSQGDNQGYPESGPESGTEAYETGVSQADSNECPESCPGFQWDDDLDERVCDPCDKSTDTRVPADEYGDNVEDLRSAIIQKDIELAAKQNAIAILEGVIYEPYCIYARIYTYMEKLLAILKQHPKYKQFLDELTNANRFSNSDIKAKIFWKLKILERFCERLTYGCQPEMNASGSEKCSAECYFAQLQISNPIRETFQSDAPCDILSNCGCVNNVDEHRQSLLEEIMTSIDDDKKYPDENKYSDDNKYPDDIKYSDDNQYHDDLHAMRHSYDLLLEQLTVVKEERDKLEDRYVDLDNELKDLRLQLQNYTSIWDEKERYKRRSNEMESLTSQYMTEIAETYDTKLKAEREISIMRSDKITELVDENMRLQTEINALSIDYERTKKSLHRKVQELEGQLVMQQEEVKRLSIQCDDTATAHIQQIISENNELKRQIANLKSFLDASEKEKQLHDEDIKKQQSIIHCLQEEFKRCEDKYLKLTDTNDELEKYAIGWKREATKEKDTKQDLLLQIQQLNKLRRDHEEHAKQAVIEKDAILLRVNDPEHIIEDLSNKCKQLEDELNDLKESRGMAAGYSLFTEGENKDEGLVRTRITEWTARNVDLENLRGESEDPYSQKHEIEDHKKQLEILQNLGTDITIAEQLQVKNNNLETVQQELINMQGDYDKLINENNKLKKITSTLEHQTQTQMIQIENLVRAKDNIQKLLIHSEEENLEASTQLKQCLVKNEDLEKSLNDAEYELSELKYSFDREESEKDNNINKEERNLNYENKKLEEMIATLKNQTQEQLKEINKLHALLEEIEKSRSKLEESLKVCQKDNSDMSAECERLTKQNEDIRKQLSDAEYRLSGIKDSLDREISHRSLALERAQNERRSMEKTSSHLLERNKELEETVEHLDRKVKSHTELNEMTSLEINEILQEVKELKLVKAQNQDKISLLADQLNAAVKVSNDQKREVEQFQNHIGDLEKLVLSADESRKIITDKMQQKENEFKTLLDQLKISEDENKLLIKENTSLEKIHSVLKEQIQNQNEQVESLVKSTEQFSGSKECIQNAFENSEREKHILQIENKEMHAQLEEKNNLQSEVEALKEKIDNLIKNNNKLETGRDEFQKQIIEMEKERSEAIMKNNVLKNENDDIKNRLHLTENENYEMKWREAEKNQMSSEMLMISQKKDIQILKQQMGDLGQEKKAVEEHLQNVENERDTALAKCELLKSDIRDLLNKLQMANDEMSKLKNSFVEGNSFQLTVENERDTALAKCELLERDKRDLLNKLQIVNDKMSGPKLSYVEGSSHLNVENKQKVKETHSNVQLQAQTQNDEIESLNRTIKQIAGVRNKFAEDLSRTQNELDEALKKCKVLERQKQELQNSIHDAVVAAARVSEHDHIAQEEVPKDDNSASAVRSVELEKMVDALTIRVKSYQAEAEKTKDRYREMAQRICQLELEKDEKKSKIIELENKIRELTQQLNEKEVKTQSLQKSIERLENELNVIIENSLTEDTDEEVTDSGGDLQNSTKEVAGSPAIHNIQEEVQKLHSSEKREQKRPSKIKEIIENKWHSTKWERERSKDENTLNNVSNTKLENQNLLKEKEQLIIDKKIFEEQVESYKNQSVTLEADINNLKVLHEKEKYGLVSDVKKLENQLDVYQIQLHELNQQKNLVDNLKESTDKQIKELKSELIYMNKLYSNALDEIQTLKVNTTRKYTSMQNLYHNALDEIERVKNINSNLMSAIDDSPQRHLEHDQHETELIEQKETQNYQPDEIKQPKLIKSDKEPSTRPINEDIDKYQDENPISHEDGDLKNTPEKNRGQSEILRDYEEKIKKLEKNLELAENHFNKRMANMKSQYNNKYADSLNRHIRGVERLESIYEDTISDMIQMHVEDVDKLRCLCDENSLRVLKLDKENRDMKTSFTQVESALDKMINDSYECGEAIRLLHVRKSRCGLQCLVRSNVLTLEIRPAHREQGRGCRRCARSCPCPSSTDAHLPNLFLGLALDQRKVAEENYVRSLACKLIEGNPDALDRQELSYLHSKICCVWRSKKGKDVTFQRRIAKMEKNLVKKQKYTLDKIMDLDDLTQTVQGQHVETRFLNVEGRRCACTPRRFKFLKNNN